MWAKTNFIATSTPLKPSSIAHFNPKNQLKIFRGKEVHENSGRMGGKDRGHAEIVELLRKQEAMEKRNRSQIFFKKVERKK